MVFYFKPRQYAITGNKDDYLIYMGKDKYENEDLLKYSLPGDVWFHVDNLSSAHVYLRLPDGKTIHDIPEDTLEDCCQLVKANSIQGNKQNKINIVYTLASNLKKNGDMVVGQVGYHDTKSIMEYRVEKRVNEIVNRLNKTKEELYPDLEAEKEAWLVKERQKGKLEAQRLKALEKSEKEEKQRLKELMSYDRIMSEDVMQTNKDMKEKYKSYEDFEDDFM